MLDRGIFFALLLPLAGCSSSPAPPAGEIQGSRL
jgi:hypothetical protein